MASLLTRNPFNEVFTEKDIWPMGSTLQGAAVFTAEAERLSAVLEEDVPAKLETEEHTPLIEAIGIMQEVRALKLSICAFASPLWGTLGATDQTIIDHYNAIRPGLGDEMQKADRAAKKALDDLEEAYVKLRHHYDTQGKAFAPVAAKFRPVASKLSLKAPAIGFFQSGFTRVVQPEEFGEGKAAVLAHRAREYKRDVNCTYEIAQACRGMPLGELSLGDLRRFIDHLKEKNDALLPKAEAEYARRIGSAFPLFCSDEAAFSDWLEKASVGELQAAYEGNRFDEEKRQERIDALSAAIASRYKESAAKKTAGTTDLSRELLTRARRHFERKGKGSEMDRMGRLISSAKEAEPPIQRPF